MPIEHWQRGMVTTEHTVWCAKGRGASLPFEARSTVSDPQGCRSYHSSSQSRITREARADGWKLTREYGWLCPPCARAYDEWKGEGHGAD